MLVFTDADLLVPLDAPRSQRRRWTKQEAAKLTSNLYIGQLKLLSVELAFLVLGVANIDDCVVVYAGAAGGHHIPALAQQFPGLRFFLYDPAPFAIEETEQLQINRLPEGSLCNGMFTDDLARLWSRRTDVSVIFICDIRTSGDTAEEHESEVAANMAMQARWVDILRPSLRAYSLKFRIPYTIIEADEPFRYLGGKLIFQPFPKKDSMELRLLGERMDADAGGHAVTYDSRSLEEIVFYHNSVIRPNRRLYANIFTGDRKPYSDTQFDNGYDCTYLLHCVKRLHSDLDEDEILALVRDMIAITSQGHWTLKERKGQMTKYQAGRDNRTHDVQRR